MGTEVLHPHLADCFIIKVAPVIIHKNGYPKSQPEKKTGSASTKQPALKPNCENGDDSYAGSAFFHSPSPRSLPLPSFFNMKQESMVEDHDGFDDSATKHLCRLLRLGASCGGKTTYKAALMNKRGTAICIFSISQWIHERSHQTRIQVIASNYQTIDLINLAQMSPIVMTPLIMAPLAIIPPQNAKQIVYKRALTALAIVADFLLCPVVPNGFKIRGDLPLRRASTVCNAKIQKYIGWEGRNPHFCFIHLISGTSTVVAGHFRPTKCCCRVD
ncbi:hypothetical protein QVD17_27014 [Tagetes erecta]|uniref:Uncharacterized protein n=1 Tax=Tagetes erecta TaxID=13708 RepID=A0AAD8KE18_TARER|nr:hypothetical protein QVD17_27014 [Tagetes erecta]